ncbi:hypothetical protein GMDG_08811, partial [Pseudogymnoascus destructans 20631-21]
TDTISAAQVKYASELGARLQDAKFTIDQFFKVHLDIVDPALKLQAAWVAIVEGIALATTKLAGFVALVPSIPGGGAVGTALLNAVPGGGLLTLGSRGINALSGPAPAAPTADESLAAARARLGSALGIANIGGGTQAERDKAPIGTSFAARFNAAIYDLSNKPKEEAEAAKSAWDTAIESAKKHIAVREAEVRAVGQGVGAQAQYRVEAQLTEAAERTG